MTKEMAQTDILRELEPTVEASYNKHLEAASDWHPHDYVPWGEGKNFAYLDHEKNEELFGKGKKLEGVYLQGEDWTPTQSKLSGVARTAMLVNLLTEDNLPSYHREIATVFGRDNAWGAWVHQWTAEEHKHGTAMYSYLMATRAIDPVEYERARMEHMKQGYDSGDKTPLEAIMYVSIQELATRIAHRNTGAVSGADGDQLAEHLLTRIAADENLHMIFYRNLGKEALKIAPSETILALTKEVTKFQMPGSNSIPGFWEKAVDIAEAGIYDLGIHANKIIKPTLKFWNVEGVGDGELTDQAKTARDKLFRYVAKMDEIVETQSQQRAEKKEATER